jgi:hypothetical protein
LCEEFHEGQFIKKRRKSMKIILTSIVFLITPVIAQEDFTKWALLEPTLGSTSGKGAIIRGYNPQIIGKTCVTDFSTTELDGRVSYNIAEFDAIETQGGILCTNGKFRAKDGSNSGTTPLRVFIKEGVQRRSP